MKLPYLPNCILFLMVLAVAACGPSESEMERLKAEKAELVEKNKAATAQLAEIKQEARKLLDGARADMKNERYGAAREKLTALIHRYPTLAETEEARALLAEVTAAMEKKALRDYFERFASENGLRMKFDKVSGTGMFKDRRTTRYNNTHSFYLYFGKREGAPPWLRLRIRYFAGHWLSAQSFIVLADNKPYVKPLARFKQRRDMAGYSELYDERVAGDDVTMIKGVIASHKATIRLTGKEGTADVIITPLEKKSMKNVLAAYKKIGGQL